MSKRAGFFLVLPLLVLSVCTDTATKSCPAFTCDTEGAVLPAEICAKCDLVQNSCVIRPCSNTTLSCIEPRSWFSGEAIACTEWDQAKWLASSWDEYYNVAVLTQGQVCIPNNPYHRCSFDLDLECSCNSMGLCTCEQGLGYSSPCTRDDICFQGYVCNSGLCLKQNSLEAGVAVTNQIACVSGIVTTDASGIMRCTYPPRTLGIIPKECESCLDCGSTDGSVLSECICGLNGVAYCDLHAGDDPWLNYLDYAPNQRFDGVIYWDFVIHNYAYLHDPPDCIEDVWKDFESYEHGAPNYSEARIVQLMLVWLLA